MHLPPPQDCCNERRYTRSIIDVWTYYNTFNYIMKTHLPSQAENRNELFIRKGIEEDLKTHTKWYRFGCK